MASPKKLLTAASLLALALPVVSVFRTTPAAAADFADPAFQSTWNRTDALVANGTVKRSFYWGPTAGVTKTEQYAEGKGGTRLVQYFDKSRMEINDPTADKNSPFYVTNGLLTIEMVSGKMQVGNNTYQTRYPAAIPLASDNDDTNAPTYQTFFLLANTPLGDHNAPDNTGMLLNQRINKYGIATKDSSFEKYTVKDAFYNTETKHNIADQFWTFLNASGPILDASGKQSTAKLSDPWFYTTGYAISEPYWANTKIAGKQTDVLVQLFQRRVLTYVPSAPAGFQVQMNNIGANYYDWRYNNAGQQTFANATVTPVTGLKAGDLGSPQNPIKLAFAPSASSQTILASGQPLAQLLGQITGYSFTASVPTSYAAVIEAMGANNVDVGFLAPFQYAIANQKYGAQVMLVTVRKGSLTYPSIFITADPNVKTVADLRNKKFAFVDPASASGFLYPFSALKTMGFVKGTNPEEFFGAGNVRYAGGHPQVVTAVYDGQVSGGAVFGGPLDPSTGIPTDARSLIAKTYPDVFTKVHIIGESQQIPNDTVAARKGLDPAMFKQIQNGLLQLTTTQQGHSLLYSLYQIDDLAPVTDSFFDPLRQVANDAGITDFAQLNNPQPTATPKP